jgi:hypothetical protein
MKLSALLAAMVAIPTAIASLALAQTTTPVAAKPTATASYPAPTCVAPKYPGKSRTDKEVESFNTEFKEYGDCMKKYVDEARATSTAAIEAGNKAVDDYNNYTGEVKKQIAAEKDDAPADKAGKSNKAK